MAMERNASKDVETLAIRYAGEKAGREATREVYRE